MQCNRVLVRTNFFEAFLVLDQLEKELWTEKKGHDEVRRGLGCGMSRLSLERTTTTKIAE